MSTQPVVSSNVRCGVVTSRDQFYYSRDGAQQQHVVYIKL